MTYSLPSRRMCVWIFVASDDATSGSVIRNAERILPSSNGSHHCLFCSAVPYLSSVSMLPVSGAEQLNTTGAHSDRKSTRLNSSHVEISYAVFCLKKKKKNNDTL